MQLSKGSLVEGFYHTREFSPSTLSLLIVIVFLDTEGNMKIQQSNRYMKKVHSSFFPWHRNAWCLCSSSEGFMALASRRKLRMQASPLQIAFFGRRRPWRSNKVIDIPKLFFNDFFHGISHAWWLCSFSKDFMALASRRKLPYASFTIADCVFGRRRPWRSNKVIDIPKHAFMFFSMASARFVFVFIFKGFHGTGKYMTESFLCKLHHCWLRFWAQKTMKIQQSHRYPEACFYDFFHGISTFGVGVHVQRISWYWNVYDWKLPM